MNSKEKILEGFLETSLEYLQETLNEFQQKIMNKFQQELNFLNESLKENLDKT